MLEMLRHATKQKMILIFCIFHNLIVSLHEETNNIFLNMTPTELRNERLAERMIKQLKRRNMEAFYCPTGKEAVKKVSELIADGSTVTWGGTATVRDLGIPETLKSRGTLEVLDRDQAETPEEKEAIYLRAFTADVYLTSANAISEDGVIVNIDRNGNRCHHLGTEKGHLRRRAQQGGPDRRGCFGQGPKHSITRQCPAIRHQDTLQDRRQVS